MELHIRDMEIFRQELQSLLDEHATEPVELIIVPDIAEWAGGRSGNLCGNPVGIVVRDGATGGAAVILRRDISQERAESVIGRVSLGGHANVTQRLNGPRALARHLLLHELAHLEHGWGQEQEDECDAWAFERM